ncbi:MAG: prolipoprotein diacylglyceryl transferase [Bacilli bacterium]|nr:prolipoprotein diacylglyceryl transferase [Bacilli bacterium]
MGIAFLIIGCVLIAMGLGYGIYLSYRFQKNQKVHEFSKKNLMDYGACLAALTLGGGVLQAGINIHCQWEMGALSSFSSIAGMALLLPSAGILASTFYLFYWKPTLRPDQRKWCRRLLYFSIAATILFFLLLGEGAGPYLAYPLPNAIHIGGSNGVFSSYLGGASKGLTLTFYGILIVGGALVSYVVSDHKMYQKYGRHGVYDSTFIVGFLSGILGARIGYVIGNWNGDVAGGISFSQEVANGHWETIFKIWEGGLTILGGAIGGIIAGSLWFQFTKTKTIGCRTGIDCAVPTILLAQAIGRWGNFFNHEVYGATVEMGSLKFLPIWLRNQMATTFSNGVPGSEAYVPLFLIEGALNVVGYFLIVYLIGKLLKKWLHRGDLGGFYLMWYGVIRLILEPLRNANFNMGADGNWSIIWSIVYIALGALAIVALHLFDYLFYTKRGKPIHQPTYKGIQEYGWVVPSYEAAMAGVAKESKKEEPKTPIEEKGEDSPVPEGKDEPVLEEENPEKK